MDLTGKHAIVIGGTSGIGLATGRQLVAAGARVTGGSRSRRTSRGRRKRCPAAPSSNSCGTCTATRSRDVLTTRQRSIVTIASLAVLRRDENLRDHILSGLDVGLTRGEMLEFMLQLLFYAGAPIANTALIVADEVFKQRGLHVEPARIFDPTEDSEALYQRGLAMRARLFGDLPSPPDTATEPHKVMERYVLEYSGAASGTVPASTRKTVCSSDSPPWQRPEQTGSWASTPAARCALA